MRQALQNLTQTNTNFKRAGKFLTTISINSCSKDEISFGTPSQMLKNKQNLSNHTLSSHSNKHDQYKQQNKLAYKVRLHDNRNFKDTWSLTARSNGENKTVGVHTNDSNEGFKTHSNYTSNWLEYSSSGSSITYMIGGVGSNSGEERAHSTLNWLGKFHYHPNSNLKC